jgi:hypothetical protein
MSYSPEFLNYLSSIHATVQEFESSSIADRSAVMTNFRNLQTPQAGKFTFKSHFSPAVNF